MSYTCILVGWALYDLEDLSSNPHRKYFFCLFEYMLPGISSRQHRPV